MGRYEKVLRWAAMGVFAIGDFMSAQQTAPRDIKVPDGYTLIQSSPIFHHIVAFGTPRTLTNPVLEKTSNGNKFYIREMVGPKETAEQWTQMITVTGALDLALNPNVTPMRMSESMVGGYKKACPESFAARGVGTLTISGLAAYVSLVGCGNVADFHGAPGAMHSEVAMIVVIAGKDDYYTVQWAERGAPVPSLKIDEATWKSRFQTMQPIRICPIVEGEKAPYPSCIGR